MLELVEDSRTEFKIKLVDDLEENIIKLIEDKPNINQEEMANLLGVTSRTIRNHIKYLVENNCIKRIGSDKTGKWIIIK